MGILRKQTIKFGQVAFGKLFLCRYVGKKVIFMFGAFGKAGIFAVSYCFSR